MYNNLNKKSKSVLTGLKVQVGTFTSLKPLPLSPKCCGITLVLYENRQTKHPIFNSCVDSGFWGKTT